MAPLDKRLQTESFCVGSGMTGTVHMRNRA